MIVRSDGRRRAEDEEWQRVLRSPLALQIPELTARGLSSTGVLILQNSCENRCFFCANPAVTSMPESAVTRLVDIDRWIDEARGIRVEHLCIGGTEPALHPAFEHAVGRIAASGLGSIEVMTSGLRLAEPGVAQRWAELGVTSIAVPLYGATARVHDDVVGRPGAFDRTLEGLDQARAAALGLHLHTLALKRTAGELGPLAVLSQARFGTRLAVGPSRPKEGVWNWAEESLSLAEFEEAVRGIDLTLVGFPRCVAPEHARAAAAVIELYFRGARRGFGDECAGCADRPHCPGVLDAELARGVRLRPRAALDQR